MVDLKILQWIFFSSNNTRKRNMIPEIIFNIRFEKVCSSSLCFLPGQEPHYPSSTSPHLFWNNIFTSKIIMSETWDISGHLSLHYFFVSKSKYSEILKSFCARVSLSSLPNINFFVLAVDKLEPIDPDGVIHNPKGRKLDRVCNEWDYLQGKGHLISFSSVSSALDWNKSKTFVEQLS